MTAKGFAPDRPKGQRTRNRADTGDARAAAASRSAVTQRAPRARAAAAGRRQAAGSAQGRSPGSGERGRLGASQAGRGGGPGDFVTV